MNSELQQRTWHDTVPESCPGEVAVPPCVDLADGLTEEEAVALALWNNRTFLTTLANLGIARGDLVQAGLLTNPQLNLLFPPIGSKQLEWTLFVPIEALILRKHRVEIAERDLQRIANELVLTGLGVARDARVAYADYIFALDRDQLAQEAVKVRQGVADLAQSRFESGDIGELEAITSRVDANRTSAEAAGLHHAVFVAEARLKNVLGIASLAEPIFPQAVEQSPPLKDLDENALISQALENRPDIAAASIAVRAAERRVDLAKISYLRMDVVADGNSGGVGPTNSGPGLRFEIPIFNRNQGLILRSQWTVDQARHNYFAVRDQVVTDVRTSLASYRQAQSNLDLLQANVLPALNDSVSAAEAAYRSGGEGYFLVLQATGQFVDARVRELELLADLRRSHAELERSLGSRIPLAPLPPAISPLDPPPMPPLEEVPLPPADAPPLTPSAQGEAPQQTVVTVIIMQGSANLDQAAIGRALEDAASQFQPAQIADRDGAKSTSRK